MSKFWLACVAVLWMSNISAQIIIGQTTGVTGSQAEAVKETSTGAKLYFDMVNRRGGVNGQKIELITRDDKQDPKLAAANARELIKESRAVALFLTRGTPQTEAIVPVLDEFDVPLIAPTTGAMSLHTPLKKNVFNVRAPYRVEAEKAISLLARIGFDRIGIICVEDSFGVDALQGIMNGMKANNISPVFTLKFDKAALEFANLAEQVAGFKPQAVMVIGSGSTAAKIMKAIRQSGSLAQLITLSNNASSGFVKDLGPIGYGVVVTQVFPGTSSISTGMSQDEFSAMAASDRSPSTLEGFMSAKVLVEALRRAGAKPTGPRIRKALESMTAFDIGGAALGYSANDHTGLEFVDLSIVDKKGRFKQ
jgi:branched-chain amino acid transport system substrate-binding protein